MSRFPAEEILDELEKIAEAEEAASYRVSPSSKGGWVIEELYVPTVLRGKGVATKILREIKKNYHGKLWIRPRPFGDMPMDIDQLKKFYEKEGFKVVDKKDNMVYIPEDT